MPVLRVPSSVPAEAGSQMDGAQGDSPDIGVTPVLIAGRHSNAGGKPEA